MLCPPKRFLCLFRPIYTVLAQFDETAQKCVEFSSVGNILSKKVLATLSPSKMSCSWDRAIILMETFCFVLVVIDGFLNPLVPGVH